MEGRGPVRSHRFCAFLYVLRVSLRTLPGLPHHSSGVGVGRQRCRLLMTLISPTNVSKKISRATGRLISSASINAFDSLGSALQFTSGELSRADGVGFVFSQRLPCALTAFYCMGGDPNYPRELLNGSMASHNHDTPIKPDTSRMGHFDAMKPHAMLQNSQVLRTSSE